MSHYLTQPEEIDYILMTEEQDAEAGIALTTSFNQHIRNNSNFVRMVQKYILASHCHSIDRNG